MMAPVVRKFSILFFLYIFFVSFAYAENLDVKYNKPTNVQSDYMQGLLKHALSYSGKKYTYSTTDETYSRPRVMESVKSGEITVMWGGTSEQMEQDFIPIRIDAYRGLMSHRILLIRKGDQSRFDRVNSLSDFQQLSLGQVKTWQDSDILEKAGFSVVKITKKQGLFYMLDGGRFDGFPRGANEAWNEMAAFPALQLDVEKKLVLVYPLPTYFFVSRHRPQVAKDVEAGLEEAIRDGSFDNYFYQSKEVRDVLRIADLPNRKAFYIANPFLPKATPLDRKELWLSIDELRKKSEEMNINQ
jgi:hypothetical protein